MLDAVPDVTNPVKVSIVPLLSQSKPYRTSEDSGSVAVAVKAYETFTSPVVGPLTARPEGALLPDPPPVVMTIVCGTADDRSPLESSAITLKVYEPAVDQACEVVVETPEAPNAVYSS